MHIPCAVLKAMCLQTPPPLLFLFSHRTFILMAVFARNHVGAVYPRSRCSSHTCGMAADSTMSNGQETASLNGEPALKRSRDSVDSLRIPREPQNKVTVVLGAQWGDEGKGKVVDLLAMDADIVCRCQVGSPSAHLAYHFVFMRVCASVMSVLCEACCY